MKLTLCLNESLVQKHSSVMGEIYFWGGGMGGRGWAAYVVPTVNGLGLGALKAQQSSIHIWLLCKGFLQMNGILHGILQWILATRFLFQLLTHLWCSSHFLFCFEYFSWGGSEENCFITAMTFFHLDCLWPYPKAWKSISIYVQWTFTSRSWNGIFSFVHCMFSWAHLNNFLALPVIHFNIYFFMRTIDY